MPRYYDDYPSPHDSDRRGRGPNVYTVSPTEDSFRSSFSYESAGPSGYGNYEYGPPPRQYYRAPSPEPTYTYDDEEPESIAIAPAEWNGYKSSATREELKKLFTEKGMSDRRVEKELDKEFAAHAPIHRAGGSHPHPSAYEAGPRDYRSANAGSYVYDSPPRGYSPPPSSQYRTRSPSPPPRRHRSESRSGNSRKEDDREAEIRHIMKIYGYSRTEAKEFVEWCKKTEKRAPTTDSRSPQTPHMSSPPEPVHPDDHFEKARARRRMIRMFMEEEGYTRTQAEDAADRHLGPKPPAGSGPRRTTSTRGEASSSSSSSNRPYERDHAKAFRRRAISPEMWKKDWIKPHTNKGKTHDEATKLADKDLYRVFAKLLFKQFIEHGLSAREADKELDWKFSKPPAEDEY